jgi:hypothetical protein
MARAPSPLTCERGILSKALSQARWKVMVPAHREVHVWGRGYSDRRYQALTGALEPLTINDITQPAHSRDEGPRLPLLAEAATFPVPKSARSPLGAKCSVIVTFEGQP